MKKRFKFKSIRARLTFWFLVVALMPLLIVSGTSYQQRITAIEKRASDKLIAVRELKLKRINSWLDEKISDIKTLADDPEIRSIEGMFNNNRAQMPAALAASIRESLQRFIYHYRDYQEVYILNPVSGCIEIATNKLMEGENRSRNPYFVETIKTGNVYIKDVFYSENLNMVSMTISCPIYCREHQH